MRHRVVARSVAFVSMVVVILALSGAGTAFACSDLHNVAAPTAPVKLVYIQHSVGSAWLYNGWGNLGTALRDNDYFATNVTYGWGLGTIGDRQDTGDWWTWFRYTPYSTGFMTDLYAQSTTALPYDRIAVDPGGQNQIVVFGSDYLNSNLGGSPADAVPPIGSNPLKGAGMTNLTVGNAKGIYIDVLEYFKTRPDKLFVVLTPPPLRSVDTSPGQAANARYLADWLVSPNGYLSGYTTGNVVVYDLFNELTGGTHTVVPNEAIHRPGYSDYLFYPTTDSRPSSTGLQHATADFVPVLNAAYNAWKSGAGWHPVPFGRPVFRFYNRKTGTHFYTADPAEKARLIDYEYKTYVYEGIGYAYDDVAASNCVDLYRFYNKKTGTHFYTADINEKNNVVAKLSGTFQLDGVAYKVSLEASGGATPVYRFYNKKTGTHFYTADETEKQRTIDTLGASFKYEGPSYYLGK